VTLWRPKDAAEPRFRLVWRALSRHGVSVDVQRAPDGQYIVRLTQLMRDRRGDYSARPLLEVRSFSQVDAVVSAVTLTDAVGPRLALLAVLMEK